MEDNKLIEYPMEQFINDFKEIFSTFDNYSISFSQNFTNESCFDMYINGNASFVYDDRIELNGEGFSSVTLFFKDFKVIEQEIEQDGNLGRSYYILFDKNKNNISEYDLVINVVSMDEWNEYL